MDLKKDAYGQTIWAIFNGKKVSYVMERDDGYIDSTNPQPAAHFYEFKLWPQHQKEAIRYVKGKVLDIGAGAGRVSLYLQKHGHSITAIDNSPLAVKVCKKRGVKHARVLPFEQINGIKQKGFSTIIMFGSNFGLFGSFIKARKQLRILDKITSADALIIAETADPYKTTDPAHLLYHKLNRKRGRMAGLVRIRIRYRNYIGDWFDYLRVSKQEMKGILKDTGWKVKKFIDSGGPKYIALIEKE